ncbi:MAG: alpha/beta fold hydrolase BchO [Halieaceae bacterium]|nr:alpha/beta fold hydrolase BchO [Halieaceae bacterium]
MLPPHDWPLRAHSISLEAGGLDWHVQRLGDGPGILCLHGTGASAHSFAGLASALADSFELVIPDLPGQGWTTPLPANQCHLDGFSSVLSRLIADLDFKPQVIIGHSAGAAIAVHGALRHQFTPDSIVSINGAFLPFGHVAAPVFSTAARWLSRSKVMAWITAAHGLFERPIRHLLIETGSTPTRQMIDCYQTLLRNPDHITGTLQMMAGWQLETLKRELPRLRTPLHLITCSNDQTVSPWQSQRLSELVHNSQLHEIPSLGHLGHEEKPVQFAALIRDLISLR